MSTCAFTHLRVSNKKLPETMAEARDDLKAYFTPERVGKLGKHGKSGAKIFGATLLTSILMLYSPEAMATTVDMPVAPITIFMEALNYGMNHVQNSTEFVNQAMQTASHMANSLAVVVQEDYVTPAAGAVRSQGAGLMDWVEVQKETMSSLGIGITDAVREIANYLIPDNKGEMVERGIIVIAALKSFSEGLNVAMKAFKFVGRKISGKTEEVAVDPTPAPAPSVTTIIHNHYYADSAPRGSQGAIDTTTDAYDVVDVVAIPVEPSSANDNDMRI